MVNVATLFPWKILDLVTSLLQDIKTHKQSAYSRMYL